MGTIFDIISIPFGYLMRFCCWISPGNNYIIALIFFTIIIELILCLLFGIKQQKNMIKQASIAPLAAAIRKKYAGRDDQVTKQKLQQETMELYQKHGYSPLSGCLPMFIQLPIIMSLYNVIVAPLQNMFMLAGKEIDTLLSALCTKHTELLSQAARDQLTKGQSRLAQVETLKLAEQGKLAILDGDAGAIADKLEGMSKYFPNYNAFGIDFSTNPNEALTADTIASLWPLLLVPVLIVATMILSTNLSKKFTYQDPTMEQQQSGCSMKVMLYSMPVFSAYISLSMPAVVGIYWIYRSISSTLQRFILSRIMPLPKFTDEDYKNAEKEMSASQSKKAAKKKAAEEGKNVGKYAYNEDGTRKRSLHHIDDEEEAEAAPAPVAKNEEDDKLAPDVDPADAPVMKDDRGTHYKKKN